MGMKKTFKRNDTGPPIAVTCLSDGVAKSLSGATSAKFLMGTIAANGNSTTKVTGTMTFNADRSTGLVYYAWGPTDLDTAGEFKAEVEVTWADGTKQTFPEDDYMIITVLADVG